MHTRKISVITTAVAAALALSACGGGGGGSSGTAGGSTSNGTTISGKAIDGYLKSATVCVDMNGDGACGADEPKATTGAGGNYSLAGVSDSAKGKNLLVLIDEKTIDEARPDHKFNATTPLIRHLDKLEGELHITPLTTMVAAEIAKGSTLNSAQEIVATALGIVNPNADYTGTPVATKAQTLVDAMQQAAAASKLDMASALAAASALTKNPEANKDQIAGSIESGKEEIGKLAEFSKMLAKHEWYEDESGKWLVTDENGQSSTEGMYGIVHYKTDKVDFQAFNWIDGKWTPGVDSNYESLVQTTKGWLYLPGGTLETATVLNRTISDGGKFTLSIRNDLTGQLNVYEFDAPKNVEGQPASKYLVDQNGHRICTSGGGKIDCSTLTDTLPAGSAYLASSGHPKTPEVGVGLYDDNERCAGKEFVTDTLTGPNQTQYQVRHCNYVGNRSALYTGIQDAVGLTTYGRTIKPNGVLINEHTSEVAGSWKYMKGLNGEDMIVLQGLDWWDETDTNPVVVFNKETGRLQQGSAWLPGIHVEELGDLNPTMYDAMMKLYDKVISLLRG
ncbi:hypothetical protein EHS17_06945 [Rhodobacteraceae bacterium CH30]|nr:hypothetical protein EHS17_06945 [Rhodobacteraceae bacterium CH30]